MTLGSGRVQRCARRHARRPAADAVPTDPAVAAVVDGGLRIEEGLDDLARRAGRPNRICALELLNDAKRKPTNIPSAVALRAALDDTLVLRLCDVYSQDYTCFGLARPAVCSTETQDLRTRHRSAAPDRSLVTVALLTCNRPQHLLLALRQIAAQDYRPLEVLVVDDSSVSLLPVLRREYPDLISERQGESSLQPQVSNSGNATNQLTIRLLVLARRASIGAKRTVAAHAASARDASASS